MVRFVRSLLSSSWCIAACGALAAACGSSGDEGSKAGGGGSGGTAGFTPEPGCTEYPDCQACADDCLKGCICATGATAECENICSGAGGVAGAGSGGTGNVGTGGTGNVGTGGGGGAPTTVFDCFQDIYGGMAFVAPDYDRFMPVVGSHCSGTNHQDIQGVERVVFLGDSITFGGVPIPPVTTAADKIYRYLLGGMLLEKFPGAQVDNCSVNGARNDDFLTGGNQIGKCFPDGGDQRTTLTIITMGGNDVVPMAKDKLDPVAAQPSIDKMMNELDEAIAWLKDPMRFPNGSYVIFANIYEYTDTSAELGSCPGANLIGLSGQYLSAPAIITTLHERYMQTAVKNGADMIFLSEDFCGHGYKRDDPNLQCFRGPGADLWFDLSCIHPNDTGHAHIAQMFMNVVNE